MNKIAGFFCILLFLGNGVSAYAHDLQDYEAYSTTARSITGDIQLAPDKIVIEHKSYPLTLARVIDASGLKNVQKIVAAPAVAARLYKIKIPRNEKFFNGNTICGNRDATWMLVADLPTPLNSWEVALDLYFFTGENEPNLNYSAYQKSTLVCGGFN